MHLVGQFIDFIGYARGGAETNVEGLCRHASDPRFSFEVVTSKSPFYAPDFQALDVPVLTAVGFYRIREASFLCTGLLSDILYRAPGLAYRFSVAKYFDRYDIIHSHSLDVVQMLIKRRVQVPIVLTMYNPIPERYLPTVGKVDCVIVRSKTLMNRLRQSERGHWLPKLVYIPPGCEFSYYRPMAHENVRESDGLAQSSVVRILFVGRLRPFKNLETLLHAVQILNQERDRKFTLTVVGSGPRKGELTTLTEELGLSDLVVFAGTFPSVLMGEVYGRHDLVVVPSSYESFSQVSLEALVAQRRLLISSGLTEFRIAFPDVPVCDPNSASDMAQGIVDVISSPLLVVDSEDLGVFRWENAMRAHYDLYESLVGKLHALAR